MLRPLVLIAASNLSAPIIMLVATPLISRAYSVEVIGLYQWALSLTLVFSLLFSLQINHSLLSSEDGSDLNNKAGRISLIMCYCAAFVTIVTLLGRLVIVFEFWFYAKVYLISLLMALNLVFSGLFARRKKYTAIASHALMKAVLISCVSVFLSFSPSVDSLILASVISEAAVLMYAICTSPLKFTHCQHNLKSLIAELRLNLNNIKFFLPSQIMSSLTSVMVMWSIKAVSLNELGLFGMLLRVVASPLYALGNALKSVFYNQLLEVKNKILLITSMSIGMHLFGLIFSSIYIACEFNFLKILLGNEWREADIYLPYFTMWIVSSVANIIPAEVFKHSNKQSNIFIAESSALLVKLVIVILFMNFKISTNILYVYPLCFYFINLSILMFYFYKLPGAIIMLKKDRLTINDA